jgi:hypothetical protein
MIHIKNIHTCFLVLAVGVLMLLVSCSNKNGFIEPVSTDMTKPSPITNYRVSNFNGGAYIIYDLPKSNNILYVKARYYLGDGTDRPAETRSSYFSDTTMVEGFADAKEYEVKLTVVSRANVESDPVVVKVNPLTPVYRLIAANMTMAPDFAGVRIEANNEYKKSVGIVFLDDALGGGYSIRQQTVTDFPVISFAVRGYDTMPKVYAAYVTDKWGNRSDTIRATVKPLFEKQLKKGGFKAYQPGDDIMLHSSYPISNLFDTLSNGGPNTGSFWHTDNKTGLMPVWCTFTTGTYAKLSRFRLIPRNFDIFTHNNPKLFSLWGTDSDRPGPFTPPLFAEEGTKIGEWENLGNFSFNDPLSGAARNASTQADKDEALKGQEFTVRFNAPKVRIIRMVVSESMGRTIQGNAADLTFWGDER